VRVHRRAGEIERVLLCPNCERLRTQVLSLDGYLLPNWYLCPEQQLDSEAEPHVLKGLGRLDVDARADQSDVNRTHMKAQVRKE